MFASTTDLAHIIQLAVTPVFLLAGIAGFLSVMSNRLGRIIDRSRIVDRRIAALKDREKIAVSCKELDLLAVRIRWINRSIALCTVAALLVCTVIVCLFSAAALDLEISGLITLFFVLSMTLLIAALIFFLREVYLGSHTLRIAREYLPEERGS
ncbi:MAG: DUF2721 domain-containing protein [Porticoccaceae bacterium]|nr:DUF2721 domain-containing protein [Porticoccaceae bacterium]